MSDKFERPESDTEHTPEPEEHETPLAPEPWFQVGEEPEVPLSPEAEEVLREQNVPWEIMRMGDLEMYLGGSPVLFRRTGNCFGRVVVIGNTGITGFLQSDEFYRLKQLFGEEDEHG